MERTKYINGEIALIKAEQPNMTDEHAQEIVEKDILYTGIKKELNSSLSRNTIHALNNHFDFYLRSTLTEVGKEAMIPVNLDALALTKARLMRTTTEGIHDLLRHSLTQAAQEDSRRASVYRLHKVLIQNRIGGHIIQGLIEKYQDNFAPYRDGSLVEHHQEQLKNYLDSKKTLDKYKTAFAILEKEGVDTEPYKQVARDVELIVKTGIALYGNDFSETDDLFFELFQKIEPHSELEEKLVSIETTRQEDYHYARSASVLFYKWKDNGILECIPDIFAKEYLTLLVHNLAPNSKEDFYEKLKSKKIRPAPPIIMQTQREEQAFTKNLVHRYELTVENLLDNYL